MTQARTVSARLLRVAKPVLGPLVASGAGRLLGHAVSVAIFAVGGWGVGSLLDGLPGNQTVGGHLGAVGMALVILAVLRGALSYLEHYFGHLTAFRVLDLFRRDVFASLVRQAPLPARTARSADFLTIVTKDVDRLEVFFAHTLVPLTAALVMPLVFALTFASVWAPLGGIVFVSYVLCLLVPALTSRGSVRHGRQIAEARARIAVTTTDTVQSARDVLGYQAGPARVEALAGPHRELTSALLHKGRADATRQFVVTTLGPAATVLGAALAFPAAADGRLSWAVALGTIAAIMPSHTPVLAVEETMAEATVSWGSARRVVEVLDAAATIEDLHNPVPLPAGPLALTCENLTLGYGEGPSVVNGASLEVEPGTIVALVGPTGSGKSTLAAAAVRMVDPRGGRIELGGISLDTLSVDTLRDAIIMVPQRTHLFAGTVRDNLLLACPGATEQDLEAACERAGLVSAFGHWDLPKGLETQVGARGTTVSGGQRQRIGIARALLRTSTLGVGSGRLLVLDEATSDLDPASQATVTATILAHRARGGSALIVAHRLSAISHADRIHYLDEGVILESGTHEDLLARGGNYAAAWRSTEAPGY